MSHACLPPISHLFLNHQSLHRALKPLRIHPLDQPNALVVVAVHRTHSAVPSQGCTADPASSSYRTNPWYPLSVMVRHRSWIWICASWGSWGVVSSCFLVAQRQDFDGCAEVREGWSALCADEKVKKTYQQRSNRAMMKKKMRTATIEVSNFFTNRIANHSVDIMAIHLTHLIWICPLDGRRKTVSCRRGGHTGWLCMCIYVYRQWG